MRVLHAIHDFLPHHRAGSEIYAYELCRALRRRGHEVHVVCAEYDASRPNGSLVWRFEDELPVVEIVNNWLFQSFEETYAPPRITAQLEHVLRAVAPDVVHVHNLLNLSFELPALAAARGIPSVMTLHDYTLLCPSGGQRVHQRERHVCVEIDTARCARCFAESHFHAQMVFGQLARRTTGLRWAARLAAPVRRLLPRLFAALGRGLARRAPRTPFSAQEIDRRLERARDRVFRHVDLFVAPSPALAADFRRFGLPGEKLRVSDYGFVPLAARAAGARSGDKLRIGFVGTLSWHKGAHVLVEAARSLPEGRFEIVLHGVLDTFPEYVAELREAARGLPVRFAGGFDRDRVAEVYADVDVLVVASLWPENSPLVIHEAFQAGVPVVGARMGGIVDLVDDGENGLLYEAFSPDALARALTSLIEEPERLRHFVARLPAVKSIDEDAGEWEEIYGEVLGRR